MTLPSARQRRPGPPQPQSRSLLVTVSLLGLTLAAGCGSDSSKKSPEGAGGKPSEPLLPLTPQQTAPWEPKAELAFDEPIRAQRYLKAQLTFLDADGNTVHHLSLAKVEPWMTIHGHGTATRKLKFQSSKERPGSFDIEGLFFTMAGPWDLRLTVQRVLPNEPVRVLTITAALEVLP